MDHWHRRKFRVFFAAVVAFALCDGAQLRAEEAAKAKKIQLAAVAVASGVRAYWRQWDSFLTFAVKRLAQALRPVQRDQMAEVFLDARYPLTQVAHSGAPEPVLRWFLDSWARVAPSCYAG